MHLIKPVSEQLSVFSAYVADSLSSLAKKAFTIAQNILASEKMAGSGLLSGIALRSSASLFLAAGAISLIAYLALFHVRKKEPDEPLAEKPVKAKKMKASIQKLIAKKTAPYSQFSPLKPFQIPPFIPNPPSFVQLPLERKEQSTPKRSNFEQISVETNQTSEQFTPKGRSLQQEPSVPPQSRALSQEGSILTTASPSRDLFENSIRGEESPSPSHRNLPKGQIELRDLSPD